MDDVWNKNPRLEIWTPPQKKTLSSAGFGLKLGVVVVPMHLKHVKYSPLKKNGTSKSPFPKEKKSLNLQDYVGSIFILKDSVVVQCCFIPPPFTSLSWGIQQFQKPMVEPPVSTCTKVLWFQPPKEARVSEYPHPRAGKTVRLWCIIFYKSICSHFHKLPVTTDRFVFFWGGSPTCSHIVKKPCHDICEYTETTWKTSPRSCIFNDKQYMTRPKIRKLQVYNIILA